MMVDDDVVDDDDDDIIGLLGVWRCGLRSSTSSNMGNYMLISFPHKHFLFRRMEGRRKPEKR